MTTTATRPATHRTAAPLPRPLAWQAAPATTDVPAVSTADVQDLIDAAGPLALRDIAGGLDCAVRDAATRVQQLLEQGCLRRDEFRRYRLVGACAR
jgi:hypothetical protein